MLYIIPLFSFFVCLIFTQGTGSSLDCRPIHFIASTPYEIVFWLFLSLPMLNTFKEETTGLKVCGLLIVHHQRPQLIYYTAVRRIRLQTHLSALILGLLGCKWNRFLFKPPYKSVIIHKSAHKCFGNWQKKLTSEEEAIRMKTFQIMSFIRSLLIQQNLLLLQAIVVLNLCTFQQHIFLIKKT